MCKCGCGTCETKITGPLLTEGKVKSLLSEGLLYHIEHKLPLFETVYRIGSDAHLSLIKEARKLYSRNVIDLNEHDVELIKTHLGEWGLFEGESVPLDLPMMNEDKDTNQPILEEYTVAGKKVKLNKGKKSDGTDWTVTFPNGKTADLADVLALIEPKPELTKENFNKVSGGIPYKVEGNKAIISTPLPDDAKARIIKRAKENGYSAKPNMSGGVTIFKEAQLDENKKAKAKKKDPPIGKPKRGGSKAYYVYVRDPKTKKIKKVSFGSGGLRAKIKNKEARNAFAARHNCKNKKDRTKAGYWSCNLPRYAPALGLGAKMNTFW